MCVRTILIKFLKFKENSKRALILYFNCEQGKNMAHRRYCLFINTLVWLKDKTRPFDIPQILS